MVQGSAPALKRVDLVAAQPMTGRCTADASAKWLHLVADLLRHSQFGTECASVSCFAPSVLDV